MKNILKSFSLIAAMAGTLAVAQEAQPANPGQSDAAPSARPHRQPATPEAQAQQWAKRLKLDADQQSKLTKILSQQRDQIAQLRSDSSLTRQDRQAKMQGIRTNKIAEFRALLNDDQKTKFDGLQERRREHRAAAQKS